MEDYKKEVAEAKYDCKDDMCNNMVDIAMKAIAQDFKKEEEAKNNTNGKTNG